jgi:hypothetical protein
VWGVSNSPLCIADKGVASLEVQVQLFNALMPPVAMFVLRCGASRCFQGQIAIGVPGQPPAKNTDIVYAAVGRGPAPQHPTAAYSAGI